MASNLFRANMFSAEMFLAGCFRGEGQDPCLPASTYGPISQTLFLGCSVMSFSTSVGWNEQTSSLTVNLVEDTCSGSKTYFDGSLRRQTWTDPDPGFKGKTYDIVGVPVYFRVDDFEYCGIVQGWDEQKSSDGYPVYSVQVSDPRCILEGAQLIINDYAGGVAYSNLFGIHGPYNVFNVYGYMESLLGTNCPETSLVITGNGMTSGNLTYVPGDLGADGTSFGSEANAFGGAEITNDGMEWSKIYHGINLLCNAIPSVPNVWSPFGRVMFRGINGAGHGLIRYDRSDVLGSFGTGHTGYVNEYYVDISELPAMPDNWRLQGTNISLLEAINTICEEAGYDYYIELVPVIGGLGSPPGGVTKFIKVRTAKRVDSPTPGAILNFVNSIEGAMSTSIGEELRNEDTSVMIIGGQKNTLYQMYQHGDPEGDGDEGTLDDTILPYFGLDNSGVAIVPDYNSTSGWNFTAGVEKINNTLQYFTFANDVQIEELELRAAQQGFNEWMTVCTALDTDVGQVFKSERIGVWDFKHIITLLDAVVAGGLAPRDWLNTHKGIVVQNQLSVLDAAKVKEDIQAIYGWVSNFASMYGQQFQVRVPYTCFRTDDNGQVLYSEEPSDGGWTEQAVVLGAATNGVIVDNFRLEDNRIGCFARYSGAATLDTRQLIDDKYIIWTTDDTYLFSECQAEPNFVFASDTSPRIPISLPAALNVRKEVRDGELNIQDYGLIITLLDRVLADDQDKLDTAKDRLQEAMGSRGGSVLMASLAYPIEVPDGVALGIKSNAQTYGPWIYKGPSGKVRIEKDDGLVPWEYGGLGNLTTVGEAKASSAVTKMQVGEMGRVSVPGYPTIPLGAELGAIAGGFFGAGTNLVEHRSSSSNVYESITYGFFCYSGEWTGLHGPNVTDIQVSVGPDGLSTDYTMRTFTPKFGRFAKFNAERLKKLGRQRLETGRAIRMAWLRRTNRNFQLENRNLISSPQKPKWTKFDIRGPIPDVGSMEVIGGEIKNMPSGTGKRAIIGGDTILGATHSFMESGVYGQTALMSLDGLVRPISMDGDGGLPQYAANDIKREGNIAFTAPPLSYSGVGASVDNSVPIKLSTLNPFSNPTGFDRDDLKEYVNSYVGHDIDILARGTAIPPSSLIMPIDGITGTNHSAYADDYRAMALRGPLLVHGWGYDTDGLPRPNVDDTENNASNGVFNTSATGDKFMDDWLKKSDTWPVGPVDLRWDNQRKVWVSPPPNTLREVVLTHNIGHGLDCGTENKIEIVDDHGVTGWITISAYTNGFLPSGTKVLVRYNGSTYDVVDAEEHHFIPIEATQAFCKGQNFTANLVNPQVDPLRAAYDWGPPLNVDVPPSSIYVYNHYGAVSGDHVDFGYAIPIGPCLSGYRGWVKLMDGVDTLGHDDTKCDHRYVVVAMEEMATFVQYDNDEEILSHGQVSIEDYWQGKDPGTGVRLYNVCGQSTASGCGIAVLDETLTWDSYSGIHGVGLWNSAASTYGCNYATENAFPVYRPIASSGGGSGSSGIVTTEVDDCIDGTLGSVPPTTHTLQVGHGLNIDGNYVDTTRLGLNIGMSSTDQEAAGSPDTIINALIIGSGLKAGSGEGCGALISASGLCFEVEAGISCVDGSLGAIPDCTEKFIIGPGLKVDGDGATDTRFGLNVGIESNNQKAAGNPDTIVNKFIIGSGLRAGSGDGCAVLISASGACLDAELHPNTCVNGSLGLIPDCINTFYIGKGLTADGDGAAGDIMRLGLNLPISTGDICLTHPGIPTNIAALQICQGLIVDDMGDECVARIGLDLGITDTDINIVRGTVPTHTTAIEFGKGFVGNGDGACEAKIGLHLETHICGCVVAATPPTTINELNIGQGLVLGTDGAYAAQVGLNIPVSSNDQVAAGNLPSTIAGLAFGSGLSVGSGGPCAALISADGFCLEAGLHPLVCVDDSMGTIPACIKEIYVCKGLHADGDENSIMRLGLNLPISTEDVCITTQNIPTRVAELEICQGLIVSTGSECVARIGLDLKTTSLAGTSINPGGFPAHTTEILFGKGFVADSSACQAQVGLDIDVRNSAGCVARVGAPPIVNTLNFGYGLVVGPGTTYEAEIGLDMGIDDTNAVATGAWPDTIAGLIFGSGLSVGYGNSCAALISVDEFCLDVTSSTTNISAGTLPNCTTKMEFGKGLVGKTNPTDVNEAQIGLNIGLRDSYGCVADDFYSKTVNRLGIGDGLVLGNGNAYEALIGLNIGITSTEDVAGGNPPFHTISNLIFGSGLNIGDGGPCSMLISRTSDVLTIDGVPITDLLTGPNLTVTGDGGTGTIGITGGTGGAVEFVTGVWCENNSIYYGTNTMHFNAAGLFTGVTA